MTRKAMLAALRHRLNHVRTRAANDRDLAEAASLQWALPILYAHVERERKALVETRSDADMGRRA